MFRNGEFDIEAGAVAVADGAELGVHVAGELGGDVETEAGGAWAHGDWGGLVEEAGLEATPDGGGQGGAVIAHAEAEATAVFAGGELAGGVGFGIVEGVDAEIVEDAVEEVAIGESEAGFVAVSGGESAVVALVERGELGEDLVAEAADADWFGGKEAVLETGDFGEIVDLAQGAVGNRNHLPAKVGGGGGLGCGGRRLGFGGGKLGFEGEGELAQHG